MKYRIPLFLTLLTLPLSSQSAWFSNSPIDVVKEQVVNQLDTTLKLGKKLESLPFCKGKKQRWEEKKDGEGRQIVNFICENPSNPDLCVINGSIKKENPFFCEKGDDLDAFWKSIHYKNREGFRHYREYIIGGGGWYNS